MAVGPDPEIEYICATLEEEAARISPANTPGRGGAYLSTVKFTDRPGYGYRDEANINLVERSALLLWPLGKGNGISPHTSVERRHKLRTLWLGIVEGTTGRETQRKAIALEDDLSRMLLNNTQRDRPSAAGITNIYGVDTAEEGPLPIEWNYTQDGQIYIGSFSALYDVEYRAQY